MQTDSEYKPHTYCEIELEEYVMKEKIYKLFLILMVSLSLGSGSLAQNEIRKLLEALSGTGDIQVVQELDEEEKQKESEEIRKKKSFLNYFQDIL